MNYDLDINAHLSGDSEINRRIFLVGCPRSGTTVLQRCIASHSRIRSFPETVFFEKLVGGKKGRCLARLNRVRRVRRDRAWKKIVSIFGQGAVPGSSRETLRLDHEVELYVRVLDTITRSSGRDIWVEKTPRHFRYVDLIEQLVPSAIVVHIVRDGRSVVGSIVDRALKYPDNFGRERDPIQAARLWNEAIRHTASRVRQCRDMVVHHRAFVQRPEEVLGAVCRYAGIKYEPGMHNMAPAQPIVGPHEPWKNEAQSGVRPVSDKFGDLLSRKDQRRVNRVLDWSTYEYLLRIADLG